MLFAAPMQYVYIYAVAIIFLLNIRISSQYVAKNIMNQVLHI